MKKISKIIGLLLVMAVLLSVAFSYRIQITDKIKRGYRNYLSSNSRDAALGYYAGCQIRTEVADLSDEHFSKGWLEESATYNFDIKDVEEWMMNNCPPRTNKEIVDGYEKYNQTTNYKYYNKEDNDRAIMKETKLNEYKRKFLNREFSALKNEQ